MLPELALSVRQPWAWAIIYAGKNIENRSWQAVNHGLNQRGRICIHASKGMTRDEYEDARRFMEAIGVNCPTPRRLEFGRIIGTVEVIDVCSESDSPWFMGPRGLILQNPEPVDLPNLVQGQLGYFKWTALKEPAPMPKPWMESWPDPPSRRAANKTPDMFGSTA